MHGAVLHYMAEGFTCPESYFRLAVKNHESNYPRQTTFKPLWQELTKEAFGPALLLFCSRG